MALSAYADMWDQQKKESEKILSDWVQENPQWWAVAIAATVQTSMDMGAGMVDVLRFGEGIAEGGVKGFAKDALRALVIIGPLARAGGLAARFLTPLVAGGRLRLAVQVAGVDGPCTYQAVNNAMAITRGRSLFATVSEMAGAVGKRVSQLALNAEGDYQLGAWIDELVPFLRQMGARVKVLTGMTRIEEVTAVAQREPSPVIFAIRTTVKNAAGEIEEIKHTVIAMRNGSGVVRFADYGQKFVGSLRELVSQWGTPASEIRLYQSGMSGVVVDGAQLTGEYAMKLSRGAVLVLDGWSAVETPDHGVDLAVPVSYVASSAPTLDAPVPPEVIQGSLEAYKSRAVGKPVLRLAPVYITAGRKKAPPAGYLTGVQYRLNALGFGAGPVDGIMGPRTRQAVRTFQRTYPPLRIDGIPGPKTQAKLSELCGY